MQKVRPDRGGGEKVPLSRDVLRRSHGGARPGTTDASAEKHVPVWEVKDGIVTVCVGAAAHPMQEEHYIEWIALQTKQGNQRKALKPGDEPKACFALLPGDEVTAALAYCNLHSLWKG